mmetsp:Transcript_17803/g.20135  ORF Transcript_17803/g.20135 Transcript_17803/m.20135 type:complete len:109 (-) Transcript_17803:1037-1363(-)
MLSAYQVVDAVNIVAAGILKGAGQQRKSALVNFVSYYILGLPFAALVTFALNTSIPSLITLWLGLVVALIVACICSLIMLSKWNWDEMAKKIASEQAEEDGYMPLAMH